MKARSGKSRGCLLTVKDPRSWLPIRREALHCDGDGRGFGTGSDPRRPPETGRKIMPLNGLMEQARPCASYGLRRQNCYVGACMCIYQPEPARAVSWMPQSCPWWASAEKGQADPSYTTQIGCRRWQGMAPRESSLPRLRWRPERDRRPQTVMCRTVCQRQPQTAMCAKRHCRRASAR